jgi:hypothetical protein
VQSVCFAVGIIAGDRFDFAGKTLWRQRRRSRLNSYALLRRLYIHNSHLARCLDYADKVKRIS